MDGSPWSKKFSLNYGKKCSNVIKSNIVVFFWQNSIFYFKFYNEKKSQSMEKEEAMCLCMGKPRAEKSSCIFCKM